MHMFLSSIQATREIKPSVFGYSLKANPLSLFSSARELQKVGSEQTLSLFEDTYLEIKIKNKEFTTSLLKIKN